MSGVQVQHEGRLITIFSASNYCGRIGNTGGTMLISPQLDYQLMEHWAPSVTELLALEASEQQAAELEQAEGEVVPQPSSPHDDPHSMRRRFSVEANRLMAADMVRKMKDLVATHKSQLLAFYEEADTGDTGEVSRDVWLRGLQDVLQSRLPWAEFASELFSPDPSGAVRYRLFLQRYSVEGSKDGWHARLLGTLHAALCQRDLRDTLAFFDTNEDGVVTVEELEQVLGSFSLGESSGQIKQLSARLLRGRPHMKTSTLLEHFSLEYRDADPDSPGGSRQPPEWARPLLKTVRLMEA